MKKFLLPLVLSLLSICAKAQQTVNCNISATQAQTVTSLTCNPAPINGFTVTFPATVNQVTVAISPTSVTLTPGNTQQFTATVGNASNTNVTWTATGGTITSSGLYTAGNTSSSFTATATSVQNPSISASATITITNTNVAGNPYCNPNGTWKGATTDGPAQLPQNCMYTPMSATPSSGTIRGPYTTLAALQASINANGCDTYQVTAGTDLGTGTINLPNKGCDSSHFAILETTGITDPNFPAENVRITPCSFNVATMPGRVYTCTTPHNLGFSIEAGNASNAITSASGSRWRVIGANVGRVPTPGIAVFNLVDLSSNSTQTNNIIFDRDWFSGVQNTFPAPNQTSDTSTTRAIYLGQSNHIAVIDSYFTNFYDTGSMSANGNTDAQCIAGGFGSITQSGWGTYKFVDNYCEASGEGILLGGSVGPALTPTNCTIKVNCNIDVPSDIEVRQNWFYKPTAWNGNTTTVVTTGWPVVKNGFEMKEANRLLAEANVIENTWYSAQVGWAFSIAPINQPDDATGTKPTNPTALTNNMTYRYNMTYNVAYGFGLYQLIAANCPTCFAQGADGVSIHDNIIGDDLNMGALTSVNSGDGAGITNSSDPTNSGLNQINHVSLSHNTFVRAIRYAMAFGGYFGQFNNWNIQNNIFAFGTYGVGANPSTGGCVGSADSADNFSLLITNCVTNPTVDHNAVFSMTGTLGNNWPTNTKGLGNWFFTSPTASGNYLNSSGQTVSGSLGFSNYGTGDSGFNPLNYAITSSSPLFNAGSDGKSVGADVATINTMIAGVRVAPNNLGNLVVYPASVTAEQNTKAPISCQNGASLTCTYSLTSGVGSVSSSGVYSAPASNGSALIHVVNGSNSTDINVTVSGTTPTPLGDCSSAPYPHSGLTENVCHMQHTETVGGTVQRNWKVVVPTNYVSGQSGMILHIADNHFLNATNGDPCGPPSNEIEGWANYLNTVPAPAPVLVCSEGYSLSSGTASVYNSLGRLNYNWLGGVVPNDVDFLRQLILITVRDMNLNPKAVFIENFFNANGNGGMVVQAAAFNSDLVAAVGAGMESNFQAMNSSFTVNRTGAANFGQTLTPPAVPVSAITLTGLYVAQVGVFSQICGNNLAASNTQYQPLTVDDTFRYWNQTDHATTTTLQPTGIGSSFCKGTYDGSGNGLASTLEVRKDTGGKLGTAIYAYELVGTTGKATPWCSFDYNGADTLGCTLHSSTIALDFRNTVCTVSQPCNHFLDAGTGPASASGYSTLDMIYKFFVSHPKP